MRTAKALVEGVGAWREALSALDAIQGRVKDLPGLLRRVPDPTQDMDTETVAAWQTFVAGLEETIEDLTRVKADLESRTP